MTVDGASLYWPSEELRTRPRTPWGRPKSIVSPLPDHVPMPVRCEKVIVFVGVALLLDIIDIADPGLGLGLGLGGPSESVSSEPEDTAWAMAGASLACEEEA